MVDREKVIKGLECCSRVCWLRTTKACPYYGKGHESSCSLQLKRDALELLKSQEARLITAEDFEKADVWANIPAWIEYNKSLGIKTIDGWVIISQGNLNDKTVRYWTHQPTDEQRKAVKWDEN